MPDLLPTPLTARRLEPWLGREMARENQVEQTWSTGAFQEDEHPSEILRTRSEPGHKLGQLYDEMPEKDSDLAAMLLKRSDTVLGLPRYIVPADGTPAAIEAADLCHYALSQITGWAHNLEHQLLADPNGIALEELVWERLQRGPYARAILPVAAIDREMWRFAFKDSVLHVRRPGGLHVPAPPGKFLVHRAGTKDSPWGKALLDKTYWYWFIKKHGWKFYALFVEKWASPVASAIFPTSTHGSDPEKVKETNQANQAKALEIARAVQNDYAIALPEGFVLKLVEATRSGDGSYNQFLQMCTRGEALVLLGEINTSGLRPGTGSYASDEVAIGIVYSKVKKIAHNLDAHLRDHLFRPIVEVNLGPDVPVPRHEIVTLESADRELRIKGIERALQDGERVPKRYYRMTMQIPEVRDGEEFIASRPADPTPLPPSTPPETPPPGTEATPPGATLAALAASPPDGLSSVDERDAAAAEVAAAFLPLTLDYWQQHQQLVLDAWDDGRFAAGEGLRWVADRLEPAVNAELIETAQVHGMGLALSHLLADGIDESAWRLEPSADLVDLPLNGVARAYLAAPAGFATQQTPRTAIDWWARLLSIGKQAFLELADANRRLAFTVAGLEEAAILLEVQELTTRAQAEGWRRQQYRAELAEVYRRAGLDPTSKWHADLVLTNGVRQTNGAIRYRQTVGNPAAQRLVPYLGWATLGDDHVRARPGHNHRVMHQRIFATSHEIWRTWWYPAGHQCRCYVYTISRREAERLGLTGAEPTGPWPLAPEGGLARPDRGFRSAPDLSLIAAEAEQRLPEQLQEAKRRGSPDLVTALRTVLTRLLGFDPFGLLGLSQREAA